MRQGIWFAAGVVTSAIVLRAVEVRAEPTLTLADRVGALEAKMAVLEAAQAPATSDAIEARFRKIETMIGVATAPTPPTTPAPATSELKTVDKLPGSWGGNMSKANLGAGVALDEMFIEIQDGDGWHASVRTSWQRTRCRRPCPSGRASTCCSACRCTG